MKKIKEYAKEFIKDESGMELLQWAIIIVATVALIGAIMWINDIINGGLRSSGEKVIDGFGEAGIEINPGETP